MNKLASNIMILLCIVVFIVMILITPVNQKTEGVIKYIPVYNKLKTTMTDIDSNVNNLTSMEQQIKSIDSQLNDLKNKPVQKKYSVNDVAWKLDIPNLLIYLDKGANESKVKLEIGYNKSIDISQLGNKESVDGKPITGQEAPNTQATPNPQATPNTVNNTTQIQGSTTQQSNNATPSSQPTQSNGATQQGAVAEIPVVTDTPLNLVQPSGFKNYILPISVHGKYMDIVSFIQYCTETTFIVPYSIRLTFDNEVDKVRADIVLRVLYIGN